MPARTYTLPMLGGLVGGLALIGCADGERSPQEPSDAPVVDGAPTIKAQPPAQEAADTVVLDGSDLPPLPSNLGDRLFDIVVRMNEDGSATRKMFETTIEQREAGAKMTADLEKFFNEHAGNPSEAAIATWRLSWGLPTVEETARHTEELMKLPFDVFLNGSLADAVDIDVKGLEQAGLQVLEGSQGLAAQGYGYIYDANNVGNGADPRSIPNSNGGTCAPYMPGGLGTVMYWTYKEFKGHVLCIINLWKSDAGIIRLNHPSFWPYGTDVDSWCSTGQVRIDSGTATTCNVDGYNTGFRCGAYSGDFLDGKTHTCYDPINTAP